MKKHLLCFLLAATLLTGAAIGVGAASETANLVPKNIFAKGQLHRFQRADHSLSLLPPREL